LIPLLWDQLGIGRPSKERIELAEARLWQRRFETPPIVPGYMPPSGG
jgi:hypothetical protein